MKTFLKQLLFAATLAMVAQAQSGEEDTGAGGEVDPAAEPTEETTPLPPTADEVAAAKAFDGKCVQCIYEGYEFCTGSEGDSKGTCIVNQKTSTCADTSKLSFSQCEDVLICEAVVVDQNALNLIASQNQETAEGSTEPTEEDTSASTEEDTARRLQDGEGEGEGSEEPAEEDNEPVPEETASIVITAENAAAGALKSGYKFILESNSSCYFKISSTVPKEEIAGAFQLAERSQGLNVMFMQGEWNEESTNLSSETAHSLTNSISGQIPLDSDASYTLMLINPSESKASVQVVYGGAQSISLVASCIAVLAMVSIAYII